MNKDDIKASIQEHRFKLAIISVILLVIGAGGSYVFASSYPSEQALIDGEPTIGPDNASLTMVVWSDYQCPHCQDFDTEVLPGVMEDYDVRVVHKDYQFLGSTSKTLGVLGNCVWQEAPDEYETYRQYVMDKGENLTVEGLNDALDYNVSTYDETCLQGNARALVSELSDDKQQARDAFGFTGTPAVFVYKTGDTSTGVPIEAPTDTKVREALDGLTGGGLPF